MFSTRKIICVFLASPGDLQEERKAVRNVVDEFNESWANELGYQVELIGWEETIAGLGRPQHLINKDLVRCDLFIGMVWKRWGTPPGHNEDYSSGFEEEFERSMVRFEATGIPEISLFFKQIPEEYKVDPGDDLKKVIEFKRKITSDKKILFQEFSTLREIETLTRKCVTAYVIRVRSEDKSLEPDELHPKHVRTSSEDTGEAQREPEVSPLSAEGYRFLEDLVERISQPDSLEVLSASDIARFRLLANSISKPGNEEMNVGVHDINILYAARSEGMELGKREKQYLVRLGFQHYASENVPLWCWYSDLADSRFDPAILSSSFGVDENEKVGAISVLTALAIDLPTDDGVIKRDKLIAAWFSDEASTRVRTAALRYLAKCGTAEDLEIVMKEYDLSDYGTSHNALECMVGILLRTGQAKEAQELVIESQFETLNVDLLRSVLSGFEGLESSALLIALEHRNPQVRLCAMKTLHGRGALEISMVERLTEDRSALVRIEAVKSLLVMGKSLREREIENILVLSQKQTMSGLLGVGSQGDSDEVGKELFQQYKLDQLKSLSEPTLKEKVRASLYFDDTAYFALVEKYFRNHSDMLRCNVDDRFSAYFEERIRQIEDKYGDNSGTHDLVKKMRELEDFIRKDLTRRGLNILCVAQSPEDLQRIRANLRDGYTGASKHDADYLGRHGEWDDINILANAEEAWRGVTQLTVSRGKEFQIEVARVITSISKKRSVSELFTIEMPAAILKKTIELCAESRFATISQHVLLALFNHESEEVRKAAAVLAIRALPKKQIKMILREYTVSNNYRYYNVIHWLDLGVSMRRDDARKVALAAGR